MFESGEEAEVSTGLGIMNELVVPCIPLLLIHDTERDLLAVEDMRNRWCSYLGQEMECESPRGKDISGGFKSWVTSTFLVPLPKIIIIRPLLSSHARKPLRVVQHSLLLVLSFLF